MTVSIDILQPEPQVLPLLAKVTPIPGESLMSLVTRACEANVFPRVADVLGAAGIRGSPAFTPVTALDRAAHLARLLGLAEGEIESRMYPPLQGRGRTGLVSWSGLRVERRFIELRARRVAPGALLDEPYHRMVWTHKALSFCPETFEELISTCPACGKPLGWSHTHGPDRCEHCKASLLDSEPEFAPHALRAKLKLATDLISHGPEVRAAAQSILPAPFRDWDAGELFSAIVEFGVAWEHPGEGRSSTAVTRLKHGQLAFIGPQHIASGYEIVRGWPASFTALVERIWRAIGAPASLSMLDLGPFGRHLLVKHSDTPLRRQLRESIAEAALAARVPLKLGAISHLAPKAVVETLTLKAAEAELGIGKRTLGRLVPDGESYISGQLGSGAGVRLNAVRLRAAVAAYERAIWPEHVAGRLGVPAYCLEAFVEAGLFARIDDPDACRLSAHEAFYERASVEIWLQKMQRLPERSHGSESLARALVGQFSPAVWAQTFKAVASGKIKSQRPYEDEIQRPLSRQLHVHRTDVEAFITRLKPEPLPMGAVMTAEAAGQLLGIRTALVAELISAGYLAATRSGRLWEIRLGDLDAFHAQYVLPPEITRAEQVFGRYPPGAIEGLRQINIWKRAELFAEGFFG